MWAEFLIIGFKIHRCNGWRFTCFVSAKKIWHVYLIHFKNKFKKYISIMNSRKEINVDATCLSHMTHLQSKPGKIDKEPRKITLALTFWYRQWGLAYTALCSFRWRPGSSRLPLPGFPSYLPRQCGKGRWFSRQSKCIMAIRIKCANISLQHNIGSSELWQRTLKEKIQSGLN